MAYRLSKKEIIRSKKCIERMFTSPMKASSFSVYPLRVVYLPLEESDTPASILVSVSKRKFKHAVDRNRVKRIIREGYRIHKHPLISTLVKEKKKIGIAFIFLSNSLPDSALVHARIRTALAKIEEAFNSELKTDKTEQHD